MTSKERANLKGLAMKLDAIFQIGKASLTPEIVNAIDEAVEKRELIKVSVLQNCDDDPNELGRMLAERTRSELVQVIGKKIVLYRKNVRKEQMLQEKEKKASFKASRKKTFNGGSGR